MPGRPPGPGRRRPPPRPVEVVSVARLAPWLLSVSLGGDALAGFAVDAPTSHIKVFIPPPGEELALPTPGPEGLVWQTDAPRPVVRTYTPRRFDPATGTLEVQFALHGPGPAASWAEAAKAGDQVAVAGPGGRFRLDPGAERWWIAGDESAVPAVATLLEALPPTARAEVHLEVADAADAIPLPGPARTSVTWHQRRDAAAYGAELVEAAAGFSFTAGTNAWAACEAGAVRRIRQHLLTEKRVPAAALTTRGYWRLGTMNHPDHDYGDD
ncbi:NADPH-dependent ferric siderophore reductase [Pseudofrankia asymbiotica]|uniref:NADPH-dependent ferric siderophore reductase n=1 Tax=Pseudofrankia asymbiotica TaxID=1834516 RepID=A0A1V2I4U3_9ACTN|nr:NADPH-dependent ferric siderophore reductase [Pseudofrankia asymbiotica]